MINYNIDKSYGESFAVETMPELIGGIESIERKLKYPVEAIKNKIEGKVYVLVLVDTLGNPRKSKIIKGIGCGCDEEALRVVKTAHFKPGLAGGKKIRVRICIPIKFSLH